MTHVFDERDPVMGRMVWCSRCGLLEDMFEGQPCGDPREPDFDPDPFTLDEQSRRDWQQHRELHR